MIYRAFGAFWLSGITAVSAVEYKAVMSSCPSVFGDDLHKSKFCFEDIFFTYKAYSVGNSENMSIYSKSLMTKAYGKNHIGGFAPHAGKRYTAVVILRNLAVIVCDKSL